MEKSLDLYEGIPVHKQVLIFSDGGSRGNPGPAASAFVILSKNCDLLVRNARYLGLRTNNQAEYEALISALEAASEIGAEEAICHLDSELVAKQLVGVYTVKNSELKKLWRKVQEMARSFKKISYINVPRTHPNIQTVDALVNETLDKLSKQSLAGKHKHAL
jgi:ribonuclease HI